MHFSSNWQAWLAYPAEITQLPDSLIPSEIHIELTLAGGIFMGIELWRNLEGHLFRELGLLHAAATYSPIPTIYLKPNQLSSRTVEELDILLNLLLFIRYLS